MWLCAAQYLQTMNSFLEMGCVLIATGGEERRLTFVLILSSESLVWQQPCLLHARQWQYAPRHRKQLHLLVYDSLKSSVYAIISWVLSTHAETPGSQRHWCIAIKSSKASFPTGTKTVPTKPTKCTTDNTASVSLTENTLWYICLIWSPFRQLFEAYMHQLDLLAISCCWWDVHEQFLHL